MIKRRSPQNIVLYTYILSDVVDFLQRAHSMGILRPSVKLVLTALVSLSVFNRNIHGLIISVHTSQIQLFGYKICISYSRKLQYLIYLCHQNTINVNRPFLFNIRTHRIRLIILVNHYLIDVTYSASSMSHCHHACV